MKQVRTAILITLALTTVSPAEPQRRRVLGGSDRREPVTVGTDQKAGAVEIGAVKIRQGTSGFFATSGASYTLTADKAINVSVDWKATTPLSEAPKLTIDWGRGEPSTTSCGLCRVDKTLAAGTYTVTVRMDDGKGGATRRTFTVTASR